MQTPKREFPEHVSPHGKTPYARKNFYFILPLGNPVEWVSIVASWVRSLLTTTVVYIRAQVIPVPATLFIIQLSVNVPKNVDDGSRTWAPAMHVGDQDGVPDSWIQPGPALTGTVFWGVNQRTDDLPVPSLLLCFSNKSYTHTLNLPLGPY